MVPGTRDSIRYHGIAPGIMGLEDGEVVRRTHALAKGVINDVAGYLLIAIWRETDGQSIADHEPGQRRRGRCACGRRRWCAGHQFPLFHGIRVAVEPSNPPTTIRRLPIAVPPVKECLTLVFGPVNHVSVVVS